MKKFKIPILVSDSALKSLLIILTTLFDVREVGTAILYFQKNESCAELC